jgi:broad specificity phosphatase PhoE
LKKLYYIRHGQSVWNVQGRMAGVSETPLTDHGRAQAKKAGQHAKAKGMHFDLIVSSPLSRAFETAQLVAKEVGYPVDKIIKNDLLIEQDFGVGEGADWMPREKRNWKGMESNDHVKVRAQQALDWLESLQADSVLVVSHSAFGRAMRSIVREEFPMHLSLGLPNAEIQEWL